MMKAKQFGELSKHYFGGLLKEHGFDVMRDRSPLYFRRNDEDIYHFVSPSLGLRGLWFQIMIFAHSPLINNDFEKRFQEGRLGVPSDTNSYLHPDAGVGNCHKQYLCNKEEGFIRNFTRQAKPALEQFGLPYLDSIQTLEDLVNTIPQRMRDEYKVIGGQAR